MRACSLLLLRISLGLLMVVWGLDKLANVTHAVAVSERYYLGLITAPTLWKIFGAAQIALGLAVILGLWRHVAYPLQTLVNGITLLSVWRSIVDPWGWVLEGTNVLFYPSLIVFTACLVLWAFRADDHLVLGKR